jgi:hypothetical protein
MDLLYPFRSGKNVKLFYFAGEALHDAMPHALFRKYQSYLNEAAERPDYQYMLDRAHYYCKAPGKALGQTTVKASSLRKADSASTYYFDVKRALSAFDRDIRINFLPGDITFVPDCPSLTKSRPIAGDNANSVILKLDRIRHFIYVNDKVPFADKIDRAIFRGKVPGKEKRLRFFQMHYRNPLCDLGDSQRNSPTPWEKPKMTIAEQLHYKFILSIEGNDVASNLKWVMSSNSVAVMPQPEYETWFMEGTLVPGKHYIEISPDFSDLDDVLTYYINHPDAVREIIRNANDYCAQFRDNRRERLIEVLTLAAYFGLLN